MKRGLFILSIIGILILILVLLLSFLVDLNRHKDFFVSKVERVIGRKVEVGKIKLTLLPSLRFELKDLRVSESEDFGEGTFLKAEGLILKPEILPLLKRQIKLREISLQRPKIVIQRSEGIAPILPYKKGGKEEVKKPELISPTIPFPLLSSLQISRLNLRDGAIIFTAPHISSDSIIKIEDLDINVENFSLFSPVKLYLSAEVSSNKATLKTKAYLRGVIRAELEKALLHMQGMELTLNDIPLQIEGNIKNFFYSPWMDMKITARDMDMKKMMEMTFMALGKNIPSDPSISGNGSMEALISGYLNHINLKLTADLDRVSINHKNFQKAQGTMLKMGLNGKMLADKVEIEDLTLRLKDLSLKAKGNVNKGIVPPPFHISATLEGSEFNSFLSSFKSFNDSIYGKIKSELQLSGNGFDKEHIQHNWTGSGTVKLEDGRIFVPNLAQEIMGNKERLQGFLFGILARAIASDKTSIAFNEIFTGISVKNGKISLQGLRMVSRDIGLKGDGFIGMDETMNISGEAYLSESISSKLGFDRDIGVILKDQDGRLRIPFAIQGTVSKPLFAVKLEEKPIEEKKPQDVLKDLGIDLLKDMLGPIIR